MTKKVFISYSRRNRLRALRLAERLRLHDIDVWWDEWDILVGRRFRDEIYDGIRSSDYFVVLLTPASVQSEYVQEELDYARQREIEKSGITILPIVYEKCRMPPSLEGLHHARFSNFEKGMSELLRAIGVEPTTAPTPSDEQLSDKEVQALFTALEADDRIEALRAANALALYRDPKARRVLLDKLSGNPIEVGIALSGLTAYESANLMPALIAGFAFQESITPFVGDNLARERALMVDSQTAVIAFAGKFPSDVSVLFLWGVYVGCHAYSAAVMDEILEKDFRSASSDALSNINTSTLAGQLVALFGFRQAASGVQRALSMPEFGTPSWLQDLSADLKDHKSAGMSLPLAEQVTMELALSGVSGGEYISFSQEEYERLRSCYKNGMDIVRDDAPDEHQHLGASLYALAKVYGLLPDDDETSGQNERIFAKLDVFHSLYSSLGDCSAVKDLQLRDSDDEAALLHKRRTFYPTLAAQFMREADSDQFDFTKILK